jgi:hypothetical protein
MPKKAPEKVRYAGPQLSHTLGRSGSRDGTLSIGDDVEVLKKGTFKGQKAVVTNPNWDGMVKVKLDGNTKSYARTDLKVLRKEDPIDRRRRLEAEKLAGSDGGTYKDAGADAVTDGRLGKRTDRNASGLVVSMHASGMAGKSAMSRRISSDIMGGSSTDDEEERNVANSSRNETSPKATSRGQFAEEDDTVRSSGCCGGSDAKKKAREKRMNKGAGKRPDEVTYTNPLDKLEKNDEVRILKKGTMYNRVAVVTDPEFMSGGSVLKVKVTIDGGPEKSYKQSEIEKL